MTSRSAWKRHRITNRRFPPPWSIEDSGAAFIVKDGGGQKLAYAYYEEELGRRSSAKLLTRDEARRIAANVAKLPRDRGAVGLSGVTPVTAPNANHKIV
jgi:hypothetical protein